MTNSLQPTCPTGKHGFINRQLAEKVRARSGKKRAGNGRVLNVFKCTICKLYHLGGSLKNK